MESKRSLLPFVVIPAGVAACLAFGALLSLINTTSRLAQARSDGVYSSAEEGMRALIARSYRNIQDVQIQYAGPNSFDGSHPHVWYVTAEVWAEARADGSPVGNGVRLSDNPGSFFLQTKDGWVHIQEGAFPEVMGFWMSVFGLAGQGSSIPSQPFDVGAP
jgi:hypothetical protein